MQRIDNGANYPVTFGRGFANIAEDDQVSTAGVGVAYRLEF